MKTSNIIVLPYRKTNLTTSFLRGRNKLTSRAYSCDLNNFCSWVSAGSIEDAAKILLKDHGDGNALALDYRSSLIDDRDLSPATINRRLSTLRSLVRLARTLGLITWNLEVDNVRAIPYRDTRGPGLQGYRLLLDQAAKIGGPKAARDQAILHLLFDMALRRGEVTALDIGDVDITGGTLAILGKGRTQKERLTMPTETRNALTKWVSDRGTDPGPLFWNFHH